MVDFDINSISREKILEMVKEEQTVRYSKGIQEIYTLQFNNISNNKNYERVNIEREIQKYILRKFGFKDDIDSLEQYWKIPSTYWHDEEVKNSIFYMKYNIFQYPKVKIDNELIDVPLINYNTDDIINLSSLQKTKRPLVILAGSMT
jgi:hypothetical protein